MATAPNLAEAQTALSSFVNTSRLTTEEIEFLKQPGSRF